MTFVLGILKNPEVQKRAQSEIDRVVGGDRLPAFEDAENLPYVNAVCEEALRYDGISFIEVILNADPGMQVSRRSVCCSSNSLCASHGLVQRLRTFLPKTTNIKATTFRLGRWSWQIRG